MFNRIILTTMTQAGKSALDDFLPERASGGAERGDANSFIDPAEVRLEPLDGRPGQPEGMHHFAADPSSSQVQAWPMLAAALVALGVSLLALAAFAKLAHL